MGRSSLVDGRAAAGPDAGAEPEGGAGPVGGAGRRGGLPAGSANSSCNLAVAPAERDWFDTHWARAPRGGQ